MMSDIKLKVHLAPSPLTYSDTFSDFSSQITQCGTANSWFADKFVFNKDTKINRFGYNIGVLSGIVTFIVGITTSLGPFGLYPYTIDNIAGSAASLGFSASSIVTLPSAGAGFTYREVALSNDFTCLKDVPYWVCVLNPRSVSSNFNFWTGSEKVVGSRTNQGSVNTRTGSLVLSQIQNTIVPGYYSGSGRTEFYPKGHFAIDDSNLQPLIAPLNLVYSDYFIHHNYNLTPYYEFGGRFELNDIGAQQIELSYIQNTNIYPFDGDTNYTCRVYDEKHSIVGTAITEKPNIAGAAVANRGSMTFYFVPKIKLNTDFPYYVTFMATGGTACSGSHRGMVFSGGNNMRSQNSHYLDYVEKFATVSAFDEDFTFSKMLQKVTPTIALGISDFIPMRRGGGN